MVWSTSKTLQTDVGNIGIMGNKTEATNYSTIAYILGLYRDYGKENGSYYDGLRVRP